jgi:hypothetical protein
MGFSSVDDLVNEITTNGKFFRSTFQKTTINGATSAAGRWHSLFQGTGIPSAGSYTGTAGVATVLNSSSAGALALGSATVTPDTRHILNIQAVTPSTVTTPASLILCDFLLYYPACVVTGTPTTMNNTATLPRYTNGVGVQCIVETQAANGGTQPALTLNYRDQSDNDQATLAMTSPVNSSPIGALYQYNGGPFLPLAAGDTGIKRINSYTLATGTTGTVAFVLVKPLAEIPLLAANTASERDFLSQLPSLPEIEDDACLGFVMLIGGSMTSLQTVMGKVEMGWG